MEPHLRPLSLGEILDRTAQLYRENFLLFAGISAVYAGVLLVLNLVQIGLDELLRALHRPEQLPWVTLGFVVLILPLMVVCAGAAVAANNRAVSWVHLGEPATIRRAYSATLPRLGRYLWLMTIVAFVIYIPFVVIYGGYFALLFFYVKPKGILAHGGAQADPQAVLIFALVTLLFGLLLLLALVYAILMALRYALAVPASVVEDLPARKALRRSIQLTKGARWRIFVLGLLIVAIQLGLVGLTQIFFVLAAFKHHGELAAWVQVVQQIVAFLTNSFIGPMYATGLTLFYYDQRVRKEGFDIEWMMQAAGLTVPAPLPEPAREAAEPWLPPAVQPEPAPAAEPAPPRLAEDTASAQE
jgi:hypothetical protein